MWWEHRDASGASRRTTTGEGGVAAKDEVDPMGTTLDDPRQPPRYGGGSGGSGKEAGGGESHIASLLDMRMCDFYGMLVPCGLTEGLSAHLEASGGLERWAESPFITVWMDSIYKEHPGKIKDEPKNAGSPVSFLNANFSNGSAQKTQQSGTAKPCTFNVNLSNASGVKFSRADTTAFARELNSIFEEAGFRVTLNRPSEASNTEFNFNLSIYNNFPASYGRSVVQDSGVIGYTPLARALPNNELPGILFPGQNGGVSVAHISASYGRSNVSPANLAILAARIGAHEFITHYLLVNPGHDENAQGITMDGFDYRDGDYIYISDTVKQQLDKICSAGRIL